MATIKDVAKASGVSVATVSRVINRSGYVSQEAELKVINAIKALDYKPNAVARALYHKTSKLIGLIIPDITNPFFPELARAVEDVSVIYGYEVLLGNSDGDPEKEKRYLDLFEQKYVDGVIMTGQSSHTSLVEDKSYPVVLLDRAQDDLDFPTVRADHYDGARKATKLLITKGAKKIAHIRGPKDITSANERYEGFIDEMEKHHLSYTIADTSFSLENAEKTAEIFYNDHPTVDGIFCSNDTIAVGFLKVALKKGIRIPDDLQIIGFDGVAFGKMVYPELTTVSQPIYDLGALASRLLIKLIEKEELEQKEYTFTTEITERSTTR